MNLNATGPTHPSAPTPAARLKRLLRSRAARWVFAAGMVVKAVLLAVAVFGAVEHAQARPLPGLSHTDEARSFHPGRR